MGRTHATSAAVAWLGGCVAATWLHHPPHPVTLLAGTALAAGGALLPDLDMSGRVTSGRGGATVAHTFGVVSLFAAECVEKASLAIYDATRTGADEERDNGHRTCTHTLVSVLVLTGATVGLCAWLGRWAVAAVLWFTLAAALRGLAPRAANRWGWLATTSAAGLGTAVAYHNLPSRPGMLLGSAVGFGALIHLLGDACTTAAIPALWPVKIRGQRWRPVGVPRIMRMRTGHAAETATRWTLAGAGVLLIIAGVQMHPGLIR